MKGSVEGSSCGSSSSSTDGGVQNIINSGHPSDRGRISNISVSLMSTQEAEEESDR